MKHLILDANNLLFRARHSSYGKDYDNVIIHMFFRSVKPLVEKFEPDCVYFVLDGYPQKRLSLHPEYKGTREYHDEDNFKYQRKKAVSIVKESVPFLTMYHPEMEADDIIADLVLRKLSKSEEKIIISSDTDFIQLCQDPENNTKLYNPVKKDYREIPPYSYAKWKSLRGDSSDNVKGVKGIGDKRAVYFLENEDHMLEFFEKRKDAKETFDKNLDLIKLVSMSEEDFEKVQMWYSNDMPLLKSFFEELGLPSITNDKAWAKYSKPFKELKDGRNFFIK
jgi:DNA polymerase-1